MAKSRAWLDRDRGNDCPILRSISSCASGDMWRYLTRSFISPLPGYVENKAGDAETLKSSRNRPCGRAFNTPRLLRAEIFARGSRRKGQPL